MTAEELTVRGPVSVDDARRRADEIRAGITVGIESFTAAADRLADALRSRDWQTLGYSSWTEYVEAEFAGVGERMLSSDRLEVVLRLAAGGLSSREIAPFVDVSDRRVRQIVAGAGDDDDLDQEVVVGDDEPVTTSYVMNVPGMGEIGFPPAGTGQVGSGFPPDREVEENEPEEMRHTEPRRRPRVPKTPFPSLYQDTTYEIGRQVRRLAGRHTDARFGKYARDGRFTGCANDLRRAHETLGRLIAELDAAEPVQGQVIS